MDSCARCGTGGTEPSGLCPECQTAPRVTCGPYWLLKEIHSRRGATVYLAWHPDRRARYAVKRPRLVDEQAKKRFLHEVRRASGLRHPNILPVHDVGNLPDGPYVAMEYVEGTSLADSRLPVRKELEILADAAEGVAAAHKKNIVHGNIKPANILVDSTGRGLLTDFGISPRDVESTSPHYLAPERARGEGASVAGDVYSLGATLYFLLTGIPPFAQARSFREYVSLSSVARPLAPSQLNREISKDFEALVIRAMEPAPEKRIPKATEFTHLLREALRKGTVSAGIIRKRPAAFFPSSPETNDMSRQIEAGLEPIETLLAHSESTNRRLSNSEAERLEQTLKGCLALDPKNSTAHILLGRLRLLTERPTEALEAFDAAIGIAPVLVAPYYSRGLLYLQQYLLLRGIPDPVAGESPASPAQEELRQKALADLQQLTDQYSRSGDPKQFFSRGLLEFFGGDRQIGFELLKRAAEHWPQNPEALFYAGLASLSKGDLDKAAEIMDRALSLRRSGLLLRYAVYCRQSRADQRKRKSEDPSEDYREALKHSDELVRLEPTSPDVWAQRASLLLAKAESHNRQGLPCTREIREALEITRQKIEEHPEVPAFYNIRGEVRRTLAAAWQARGEPVGHLLQQAIPEYRRALAANGDYVPALVNLSSALLLQARSGSDVPAAAEEAKRLLGRVRELRPDCPLLEELNGALDQLAHDALSPGN